jgi:hypothetical protein
VPVGNGANCFFIRGYRLELGPRHAESVSFPANHDEHLAFAFVFWRVSILRQARRRLQLLLGSCRALNCRLTSKPHEETAGHPQRIYEFQTGPLRERPQLLLRNSVRITRKLDD